MGWKAPIFNFFRYLPQLPPTSGPKAQVYQFSAAIDLPGCVAGQPGDALN